MERPHPLSWSDWPARRRPARAALAALVIVLTVAAVHGIEQFLALVAAVLLLAATADVLLPTRFSLDESGVRIQNPFRRVHREWSRFGEWYPAPEGFRLEGAGTPPLLRRFRAAVLRCPGREAAVDAWLRSRLGEPRGRPEDPSGEEA